MMDNGWTRRWTLLVVCSIVASYWLIQLSLQHRTAPQQPEDPSQSRDSHTLASRASGIGIHVVIEGVSMVYEAPAAPTGVLLLFHGCQHSCEDWWPQSPECTACTGLPEEVRVVQQAVDQGYVAVAASSQQREPPRCWDTSWPPQSASDLVMVEKAVSALIQQQGWSELPLFALGASSGGAFALLLARHMPLQGVCCQIMSIPTTMLGIKPADGADNGSRYPPTVFAHMVRDQRTAQGVAEDVHFLKQQGTPVLELPIHPQPLMPLFFSNRTSVISPDVSAAILATLKQADMVDADGMLRENPRQTAPKWQSLLRKHVPATRDMKLQHDESAVHEELNLAWAGHELSSDATQSTLNFFEDHRQ